MNFIFNFTNTNIEQQIPKWKDFIKTELFLTLYGDKFDTIADYIRNVYFAKNTNFTDNDIINKAEELMKNSLSSVTHGWSEHEYKEGNISEEDYKKWRQKFQSGKSGLKTGVIYEDDREDTAEKIEAEKYMDYIAGISLFKILRLYSDMNKKLTKIDTKEAIELIRISNNINSTFYDFYTKYKKHNNSISTVKKKYDTKSQIRELYTKMVLNNTLIEPGNSQENKDKIINILKEEYTKKNNGKTFTKPPTWWDNNVFYKVPKKK